MAEERKTETGAFGRWGNHRGGGEMTRIASLVAGGAQRARLLVSGVAGPLSDRQKMLAMDLLRDLEQLCDATGNGDAQVEPQAFDLGAVAGDVVGAFRFVAHRKQLALTLTGASLHAECLADPEVVRTALIEAVGAAVTAAPVGSRVAVEIARSADRLAVDVSAPGWEPQLPPAPPPGSGAALSVLRTASGARLVLSVPAAL